MTDVDYKIFENDKTGTFHLAIHEPGAAENMTVCGINMMKREFKTKTLKTRFFWMSAMSCKNCARAAKR